MVFVNSIVLTSQHGKSTICVQKSGKQYNMTNNCVVCKKKYYLVSKRTFKYFGCCVTFCSLFLSEYTKTPRDCFKDFHEIMFMNTDYSTVNHRMVQDCQVWDCTYDLLDNPVSTYKSVSLWYSKDREFMSS